MTAGQGYQMQDGRYADTESAVLLPLQACGAGETIGPVVEMGGRSTLRCVLDVTAKSGTNPTLDVTIQTSYDQVVWRTLGTFAQKTDVGYAMSGVTAQGTSPPTLTLTGTPDRPIELRVECTTSGNRGVAVIRYSIDGGVTWTYNVTTAATVNVGTTGLVLNFANAAFSTDNVYTARAAGYERKSFGSASRFVRAVASVGGSSTPTVTARVAVELV